MSSVNKEDLLPVVVVGAGPSGLVAAIAAAESGVRVVVLEKQDRCGRKLLASGGGHCNLSNSLVGEAFMAKFGRQGRFMRDALAQCSPSDWRRYLEKHGLPLLSDEQGRWYPKSERALDVLNFLLHRAELLGVEFRLGCVLKGVSPSEKGFQLETGQGELACKALILAVGGCGYAQLGGNASGMKLAKSLGHRVVEPSPAMVGLRTEETWPGQLAGLVMKNVLLKLPGKGRRRPRWTGDLLYTHGGLSGPVIMDASGHIARQIRSGPVKITLCCGTFENESAAREHMDSAIKQHGKRSLMRYIAALYPERLARLLCAHLNVDSSTTMSQLPAAVRRELPVILFELPLTVVETEGFDQAMVMAGGIDLRDVDPRTLQSRIIPGLFFSGELLDLDGACGGFNLQWAATSGWIAGQSAAQL